MKISILFEKLRFLTLKKNLKILSGILIRRSHLIEENRALANQNIELRMLLAQYMQSSVNQELEIPPTKILQMEYSK